jgi:hypothetical protein
MSSIIVKLAIALGIALTLGAAYFFTIGGDKVTPSEEFSLSSSEISLRTQKILQDTKAIDTYALDVSVFDDRRFDNLNVYSVTLTDVATGRSNPFAPIE